MLPLLNIHIYDKDQLIYVQSGQLVTVTAIDRNNDYIRVRVDEKNRYVKTKYSAVLGHLMTGRAHKYSRKISGKDE